MRSWTSRRPATVGVTSVPSGAGVGAGKVVLGRVGLTVRGRGRVTPRVPPRVVGKSRPSSGREGSSVLSSVRPCLRGSPSHPELFSEIPADSQLRRFRWEGSWALASSPLWGDPGRRVWSRRVPLWRRPVSETWGVETLRLEPHHTSSVSGVFGRSRNPTRKSFRLITLLRHPASAVDVLTLSEMPSTVHRDCGGAGLVFYSKTPGQGRLPVHCRSPRD